jgi:hypothetical protein
MAAWPIYFVDRGQNRFERLLGTIGKAMNRPSSREDPNLSEHLHLDERSAAAFIELNPGHHYFENRARPLELRFADFFVTSAQSLSKRSIRSL